LSYTIVWATRLTWFDFDPSIILAAEKVHLAVCPGRLGCGKTASMVAKPACLKEGHSSTIVFGPLII
jgi:hypothetical protein